MPYLIYFEVKRKDFWENVCHHAATLGLITYSYQVKCVPRALFLLLGLLPQAGKQASERASGQASQPEAREQAPDPGCACSFMKVGTMVFLCHDVTDIFMETAKMFGYIERKRISTALFVVFMLIWFAARIVYFPFWVIWSVWSEPIEVCAVQLAWVLLRQDHCAELLLPAADCGQGVPHQPTPAPRDLPHPAERAVRPAPLLVRSGYVALFCWPSACLRMGCRCAGLCSSSRWPSRL